MEHPKEFAEGLSIGIIMDGNGRWAKQRGEIGRASCRERV